MLMCIACGFADSARAQAPYAVTVQRNVAVKMRDGVTLYADVYRPRGDDKFPVLLTRTPYDKTGNLGTCMRIAAAGYVCVAQDVAGDIRRKANGIPSSMNPRMDTTRSNGWRTNLGQRE